MASWAAPEQGEGGGGSLRHTISRSAFDLGQGLPGSKWSQLLLQAAANGQEGAGEEAGRARQCGGEKMEELGGLREA